MSTSRIITYVPRNSVLHKANPATKLILTFFLIFIPWVSSQYLFSSLLVLLIILIVSRSYRDITYVYKLIVIFAIIFIPLNTLLYSSIIAEKTYILRPWITREGLYQAITALLRIIIGIVSISLFFVTTSPEEVEDFLLRIKAPATFVLSLVLSVVFAPLLLEEVERIKMAQMLRGAARGKKIRSLGIWLRALGIPLIVSALHRALRMAEALEVWGAPSPIRTVLTPLSFSMEDIFIITLTALVLLGPYTLLKPLTEMFSYLIYHLT